MVKINKKMKKLCMIDPYEDSASLWNMWCLMCLIAIRLEIKLRYDDWYGW